MSDVGENMVLLVMYDAIRCVTVLWLCCYVLPDSIRVTTVISEILRDSGHIVSSGGHRSPIQDSVQRPIHAIWHN